MSGLRAEDVKEALEVGIDSPDVVKRNIAYATLFAAARAWLTPNYEAAAVAYEDQYDDMMENGINIHAIVDAAFGFQPGDKGDEK